MADICCDVSPREATVEVSESSPRTARRRRMEIRRFRFVGDESIAAATAAAEPERKRHRVVEPSTPSPPPPQVSSTNTRLSLSPPAETVRTRSELPVASSASITDTRPKYGTSSVCGRRRDMEDAVSVRPKFFNHSDKYHLFGVFDGHGCSHVATSCSERMHEIVADELERINAGGGEGQPAWDEVMKNSFSRMDAEVGGWRNNRPATASCRCVQLQASNSDHVGSTATVSVVTDDRIVVANCGDSRAVLCRRGVPVPLSTDHKPDRHDELLRIEAAGGRVIYWDGARVLGVLAMSRAIGDNYLKPFVISEPEITVTERSDEDECLIIASDGLWDVLTNEMACDIARMCLRSGGRRRTAGDGLKATCENGPDRACSDAAMLLTKVALARHSADNVSVVVVDLRRKSSSQ